jgi:hypothetical protein
MNGSCQSKKACLLFGACYFNYFNLHVENQMEEKDGDGFIKSGFFSWQINVGGGGNVVVIISTNYL